MYEYEDELVDDMINKLLSKERDDQMRIDIEGYPADVLSGKSIYEAYHPVLDGDNYFKIEIIRFKGEEHIRGFYDNGMGPYVINIEGKHYWFSPKKMDKILNDNIQNGTTDRSVNEEAFYIRVPKRCLMDNADIIQ